MFAYLQRTRVKHEDTIKGQNFLEVWFDKAISFWVRNQTFIKKPPCTSTYLLIKSRTVHGARGGKDDGLKVVGLGGWLEMMQVSEGRQHNALFIRFK